jgi:hypothetical protein
VRFSFLPYAGLKTEDISIPELQSSETKSTTFSVLTGAIVGMYVPEGRSSVLLQGRTTWRRLFSRDIDEPLGPS